MEKEDVSEVDSRVGRFGWRRQHEYSGPQTPSGEPEHSLFSLLTVRLYWHGSCPPWLNAELLCNCLLNELPEHSCLCCIVAQPTWVCYCRLCTQTDSQHHGQSLLDFSQQLSFFVSVCEGLQAGQRSWGGITCPLIRDQGGLYKSCIWYMHPIWYEWKPLTVMPFAWFVVFCCPSCLNR